MEEFKDWELQNLHGLETQIIGQRVYFSKKTTSTNDMAWEAYRKGALEGTVFWADEQTEGRGRQGKQWKSHKGLGILMSLLVYPDISPCDVPILSVASAVAIAEGIRNYTGLSAMIKWPNDILIQGRKASGILIETRISRSGKIVAVVGIGVNVNQKKEDFDGCLAVYATSLAIEKGENINREALIKEIFFNLDHCYISIKKGNISPLIKRWRELSCTLEKYVTLTESGKTYNGRVIDIGSDYGLLVKLDSGENRVFRAEFTTLEHIESQ